MRVHIDPATGEFVTPPTATAGAPGTSVVPTQSNSTNADNSVDPVDSVDSVDSAKPAEPVRQERVPGGGFKVDTRGRFQPVVGSVEPCGEAKVGCTATPSR